MKIDQRSNFLRVFFSDHYSNQDPSKDHAVGTEPVAYSDFHYFWLRHNCNNVPLSRHPLTNERIIDSSEIPLDIQPKSVTVVESGTRPVLSIVWQNDHVTEFDEEFLFTYKYAPNRRDVVPPPPNDVSQIEVDFSKLEGGDLEKRNQLVRECLERVKRDGAVVVRNRGEDTEQIM